MQVFYNYYIIFGNQFGFFDLGCIEKMINTRVCDKTVIFLKTKPHQNILTKVHEIPSIEIKVTDSPKKEAKRYKKSFDLHHKDLTSAVFALETVADRSMFLDVG